MDETPKQVVERFYSGLATGEMNFDLLDEELEWITRITHLRGYVDTAAMQQACRTP